MSQGLRAGTGDYGIRLVENATARLTGTVISNNNGAEGISIDRSSSLFTVDNALLQANGNSGRSGGTDPIDIQINNNGTDGLQVTAASSATLQGVGFTAMGNSSVTFEPVVV